MRLCGANATPALWQPFPTGEDLCGWEHRAMLPALPDAYRSWQVPSKQPEDPVQQSSLTVQPDASVAIQHVFSVASQTPVQQVSPAVQASWSATHCGSATWQVPAIADPLAALGIVAAAIAEPHAGAAALAVLVADDVPGAARLARPTVLAAAAALALGNAVLGGDVLCISRRVPEGYQRTACGRSECPSGRRCGVRRQRPVGARCGRRSHAP